LGRYTGICAAQQGAVNDSLGLAKTVTLGKPLVMSRLAAFILPDRFIAVLLVTVALAALLPVRGEALALLGHVSTATIVALFFVHGARLGRDAVLGGFTRLQLHGAVLAMTFVAFPIAGFLIAWLFAPVIGATLTPGLLFLCALPSTVASSIAAVSMARGHVAASVVAAALSNMAGVVLTPLIFALLVSAAGAPFGLGAIGKVLLMLALPFALGQIARPLIGPLIEAHPVVAKSLDRLTILLAAYVALSAAAGGGLLGAIDAGEYATLALFMFGLLALAIATALAAGHALGFDHGDRMVLLFNGIQKSAVSGAPMARIFFPGAEAGLIIVPLLIYYIPMLTISAIMAARFGAIRETR